MSAPSVDTSALAANIEEGTQDLCARIEKRPLSIMLLVVFGTVALFAGGGPIDAAMQQLFRPSPRTVRESRPLPADSHVSEPTAKFDGTEDFEPLEMSATRTKPRRRRITESESSSEPAPAQVESPSKAQPAAAVAVAAAPKCGDGKCEAPETIETCFADCPAITTPASCGASLHSDPQGFAVVDGRGHHVKSSDECCAACAAHAAKNKNRPCNSWVFCYMPHCWSADNGNTHLFGECWLKWQADPQHPLYGQRGQYTEEFRRRNRDKHLNGNYPTDKNSVEAMTPFGIKPGSRRNLTVPSHVAWMGGVMGAAVDATVQWTTDADGTMRSSTGDVIVDYRPWESREQNLKRGVKPEQMKF